jgi:hypothetical protein
LAHGRNNSEEISSVRDETVANEKCPRRFFAELGFVDDNLLRVDSAEPEYRSVGPEVRSIWQAQLLDVRVAYLETRDDHACVAGAAIDHFGCTVDVARASDRKESDQDR